MKKLNIKILMLVFCACIVQNVGAQVVRVYTNDGAVREISSVEKVMFPPTQTLGKSLYQELQSRKTFTTTLRLIDDLGYTEKFSTKGSFTLFAASDAAFAEFFKHNAWNVTSYATLSKSQKLQLLKMSVLNDAYSLDAITTTYDGDDLACLRHNSLASESDFVAPFAPSDLPTSSEEGNDAFKPLRDKGTTTYLSTTGNVPMLNQFYANVLKRNNIPVSDIELMTGRSWNVSGQKVVGYLNDCRILEGGITCSNGYLYILDKVLFSVGSTAEHIRTNNNTQLFNILLERFAAPYYSEELTLQYNKENNTSVDSVYEMGFVDLPTVQYFYDTNQLDIPTMFVPSNEAVINYFVNGNGAIFLEEHCNLPNTTENISQNLKELPYDIVKLILENVMGHNFAETTPSRFHSIRDTDMNELFPGYASVDEYYSAVVKQCLYANNGIVYVTKIWPTITEMRTVLVPLSMSEDTKIFNAVIKADDNYIEGSAYNNAPLKQYFSTYLKAMQNHFSFFVPIDEGLENYGYVEAASFATQPYGARSTNRYYWSFKYDDVTRGAIIPVEATAYNYTMDKGQRPGVDKKKGSAYVSKVTDKLSSKVGQQKRLNLIEMVNQHFIVHESDKEMGNRKYFMSRGGAPVCITSMGAQQTSGIGLGVGATVKGGYQLMLDGDEYLENDHAATVLRTYDFTEASNGYGNGNGMTYIIDRPIQPTMRSVYNHFKENEALSPFYEFYELANPAYISDHLLRACGYYKKEVFDYKTGLPTGEFKDMSTADQQAEKLKFHVFVRQMDNVQGTTTYNPANREQLVRFFNNYNYTIYVPTNEQVAAARDKGLMTWSEIDEWVKGRTNDYEDELSETDRAKARAMITVLVNFVKYHFQDNSLFVDNVSAEDTYMTSCFNNSTGNYVRVNVQQTPSRITLTDAMGNQVNVVSDEGKYNIFAREISYDAHSTSASYVKNSSYVVIHQIDKYLNFNSEDDYKAYPSCPKGRFDIWNYIGDNKTKELKSYVAKYKLKF